MDQEPDWGDLRVRNRCCTTAAGKTIAKIDYALRYGQNLSAENETLRARVAELETAQGKLITKLKEQYRNEAWSEYHEGSVKDNMYFHNYMSGAEWLMCDCGFKGHRPIDNDDMVSAVEPTADKRLEDFLAGILPEPPKEEG